MSNKLLLTGAVGTYRQYFKQYWPLHKQYARKYGAHIHAELLRTTRSPSWSRIPTIMWALNHYDYVCWVDINTPIQPELNMFEQIEKYRSVAVLSKKNFIVLGCQMSFTKELKNTWKRGYLRLPKTTRLLSVLDSIIG